MSSQVTLKAEKRDLSGTSNAKRLRGSGIVPGVIYGKAQDNYSVQLDAKQFEEILREQSSENFLVSLEIEGAKEKSKLAMVQDIQSDPLSSQVLHIDFHAVNENETIHATLPVVLHGEPEGVKGGGLLEHMLRSLEIHCLPGNLPERIDHDISALKVGEGVHVSDLNFPEGVSTEMNGDVLVAIVNESRASVAAAAGAGAEAAAPAEAAE